MTLAEGLRSLTLYKLLMAGGLFTFTAIGALVHFIPILTDSGTAPLTAAATNLQALCSPGLRGWTPIAC